MSPILEKWGLEGQGANSKGTLSPAITLSLVPLQSLKEAPPSGSQDLRLVSEFLQ